MSWQRELDELRERERMAREMGGPDKVQRQHDGGRLTVRERIERLVDQGSFHEVGAIAGKAEYDADGKLSKLTPANCVMGRASIDGRPVVVLGDDFTVRGGSADATIPMKPILAERMANELRLPIVRIIEGSGGGGSVKTIETTGRSNLPGQLGVSQSHYQYLADNLGAVPVVALGLGSVAGLGAARLAASHYSVMTKSTSAMFVAGPPVVARVGQDLSKQELGGWEVQCRAGAVDHAVDTEEEAFQCARRFLSYLPPSVYSVPARGERSDPADRREEMLFSVIPRDRRKVYKMRADHRRRRRQGLVLRDGPDVRPADDHGPRAPRRAARGDPGQRPLSLRRRLDGGCLRQDRALRRPGRDLPSARRLSLRLPGLPDRPRGREVGDHPPRRARHGRHQPVERAVVHGDRRNSFGVAGAAHVPAGRLAIRYAWLSAWWGSLPLEGGIEAAYRAEIDAAARPQGQACRDRGAAQRAALALPHRRDLLGRGDHRPARHAPAAVRVRQPRRAACARPGRGPSPCVRKPARLHEVLGTVIPREEMRGILRALPGC